MIEKKTLKNKLSERTTLAVVIPVIIAILLTLLGIYGIGQYGIAIFMLIPVFIGASSTLIYGYNRTITWKEARKISAATLTIYTLGLLVFAIEGVICILMAAPIGVVFCFIGALIGYAISKKTIKGTPLALVLLTLMIPLMGFVEKSFEPSLIPVTTSIEIEANPSTVWKNVIEFSELDKPTEFIFKTGISYPTHATIKGKGVGAVRHCNFTTGSFIEPITVWNEPKLLKFDVEEQPTPMKELSFYDINAPHLHDYFISKQGQFKLTKLGENRTLLEGTTWYYHNIRPEFYWKVFSNYIIHKIHERVLKHIKTSAEKNTFK